MNTTKNEKIRISLQKFINVFQTNKYLQSVTRGLSATMPMMIIGSFAELIADMQIGDYQKWIAPIKKYLELPVNITINLVAVYAVCGIAYSLAKLFKENGLQAALIALLSFLLITPMGNFKLGTIPIQALPVQWLGAQGLFAAIIVGLVSSRLYIFIVQRHWTIKMPNGVPQMIADSFASLIPAIIVTIIFTIIASIFSVTPVGSLHQAIYTLIQAPLTHLGNTLPSLLFAIFLMQLLWVCGIHGAMVVMSVMTPIWSAMALENLKAFKAGLTRPNIIDGLSIYASLAPMLGLVICLLFFTHSKQLKTIGKLGAPAALFGIHEPLIFGLPIVLNPYLAIPYIFSPLICVIIGYICVKMNIIPVSFGIQVPFGTPIFLNGLLAGSWKFAVLQTLEIPLCVLIYYPFVKIFDKQKVKEEKESKEKRE